MKKQFLIVLMVTIALAMIFVVGCTSFAVNAMNPSPSPHATTFMPAVTGIRNQTIRGDNTIVLAPDLAGAGVLAAIALAGGFVAAAAVGGCATVTAAVLGPIVIACANAPITLTVAGIGLAGTIGATLIAVTLPAIIAGTIAI